MSASVLSASGLTRRFGERHALAGVDLEVGPGEVCALLGRNGAGKTTFIHCALGLLRPSAGVLSVLGERPGALRARRAIGAVLQDTDLPDLLTGREHLALAAAHYAAPVALAALIEEASLGDFVDRRYGRLSGGQKRRVQLAVALVGRPRLLFLDEPTTGLDGDARRAVWQAVRRLAAGGTTVLLTTHDLAEAEALADRIAVLGDGRLVADAPVATVRGRVGGAVITCVTRLGASAVAQLPAVRRVTPHGRLLAILSDDAPATLAALLRADPAPAELTVRKPTLEEAFTALLDTTEEAA